LTAARATSGGDKRSATTTTSFFAGDIAVWNDRDNKRLVGLNIADGTTKWQKPDPGNAGGSPTHVVLATTNDDLTGPADSIGRPIDHNNGDDSKVVQVSSDRSARVLDASSGAILGSRPDVASTSDNIVAHNGRLIVRDSSNAQRILSYRLDGLDHPEFLYDPQQNSAQLSNLTPCGDDRICLIQKVDSDPKTATVIAFDAVKGGKIWSKPVDGVQTLVPVGKALLAASDSTTTLLDDKGTTVHSAGGPAVRLNAGNVLWFTQELTTITGDPSLAGQHIGDDRVELGALTDIRTQTCSWNTSTLACVGDEDFVIERFAG
jgi:molecular chaperone HscA